MWRWIVLGLAFSSVLVLLVATPVWAEEDRLSLPEDISNLSYEIYKKCEKSGNPEATIKCLMHNDKRYGAELTRIYEYLLGRVNKDRAKLLSESQRAWVKFQKASCTYQGTLSYPDLNAALESAAQCELQTTLQRLDTFRYLEYGEQKLCPAYGKC